MKHIHTFESFLNEAIGSGGYQIRAALKKLKSGLKDDDIVFTTDDEKLDQMLNSRFNSQLDIQEVNGDSYYILSQRDFDRFIDLADSSGFDVDYENSEDAVVYVQESTVNEADKEVVLSNEILDFLEERGVINGSDAQKVHKDLTKFLKEKGVKESVVNEAQKFNVKDLPKGAVLTFNDGETWMVTKVIGNSSNPQGYLLAPHGKTREYYISMQIEFSIKKLEDDLVAVN
jgi:hypothetical protein